MNALKLNVTALEVHEQAMNASTTKLEKIAAKLERNAHERAAQNGDLPNDNPTAPIEVFKPEVIAPNPAPGPITPEGKAHSRLNATKHGALSEVVPLHERTDYAEHLQAVRDDYNPVGYIEERLTDRIASSLWRLRRMERYESAIVARDSTNAVKGLFEFKPDYSRSSNPAVAGLRAKPDFRERKVIEDELNTVRIAAEIHALGMDRVMLEPGVRLQAWLEGFWEIAHAALKDDVWENKLWKRAERKIEKVLRANGLKDYGWNEEDAAPFLTFELAGEAVHTLARVTLYGETLGPLSERWEWFAGHLSDHVKALEKELSIVGAAKAFTAALASLPHPDTTEKIARYETHLERGLYRAMHELEAMQDRRKGKAAPLARVQVHGGDG
jgi:hypothetical protein